MRHLLDFVTLIVSKFLLNNSFLFEVHFLSEHSVYIVDLQYMR